MMNSKSRLIRLKFVFSILGVLQAAVGFGEMSQACSQGNVNAHDDVERQVASLPKSMTDALQNYAREIETLSLDYVSDRSYPGDSGRPLRIKSEAGTLKVDGSRIHVRCERKFTDPSRKPLVKEQSFDGQIFFEGNPNISTPIVDKFVGSNPESERAQTLFVYAPYLESAGIYVPETAADWKHERTESLVLHLAKKARRLVFSGTETVTIEMDILEPAIETAIKLQAVVTSETLLPVRHESIKELAESEQLRRIRIVLDPSKNFALISRRDYQLAGEPLTEKLLNETECSEFREVSDGTWLPHRCVSTRYVKTPELIQEITEEPYAVQILKVRRLSLEVPDDESFGISYGAGSIVADRSTVESRYATKQQTVYRFPASNDELRVSAQKVNGGWTRLLVIANVVVILTIILAQWIRSRQARPSL